MATNPAEQSVYPFSDRDGEPIPLDIVDPLGILVKSFGSSGVTTLTLPALFELGHLYSLVGCIVQYQGTLPDLLQPPTDATSFPNSILVPPGTIITSRMTPGPVRIIPFTGNAGSVVFQAVRKWASLGLKQQVRLK